MLIEWVEKEKLVNYLLIFLREVDKEDNQKEMVLWLAYATHSSLKPVPTLPRKRQIAVTV
jgi:hypothetical protein